MKVPPDKKDDLEREEVLRRMLKLPPKENKELKTGNRKQKKEAPTKKPG